WARGISEFGAVIFLAFYPMVAPTLIYYRFTTHGLKGSQPVAVLLILVCFTVFLVLRLYTRSWGRRQ
ncbi:MAG: molybdenum ABC transporter permease, partial [Candidatus Bathyarchaeia archaeon]